MQTDEQEKLLNEAVERLKCRQQRPLPENIKADVLRYINERGARYCPHSFSRMLRYAAAVAICCGIFWFYSQPAANDYNLAWGDVVKKASAGDFVHLYQYDYLNGTLEFSRQGWGWYSGRKLCFLDDKGIITVDDGQSRMLYSPDGTFKSRKDSEFGSIDKCVSSGNFVFDMLIKGVFGYNDDEVALVRPAEVGEDFLVYKFSSPQKPVDFIDSVSVLVGKGSALPIQAKVATKINDSTYSLIIFDYQNSDIPLNIQKIMGIND